MKFKISVLPGDGVGPEVTRQALQVLRTVADLSGLDLQFQEYAIGGDGLRQFDTPLPRKTLDGCLESQAVLLGAVGAPEFDGLPKDKKPETGLLQLRLALGCFANLRPAAAIAAIADRSPLRKEVLKNADVLIVRELLGGLYFGEPRGRDAGAAVNTMRYSQAEIERVSRVAFEQARKRRGKLTSVDKANVLETSMLWREVVERVAQDYPGVNLDHMYVDACAMHLIANPSRFDVILTENLFGDVLSDEAAAITGSIGMLGSASLGGSVDLYEPVHGSAPDIAGKGIANPLGAIASVAMMLRYTFDREDMAGLIEEAIRAVLARGYRTADLSDGSAARISTAEMGSLVEQKAAELIDRRHAYHAV